MRYFNEFEVENDYKEEKRVPIDRLLEQIDFYDETDQKIIERIMTKEDENNARNESASSSELASFRGGINEKKQGNELGGNPRDRLL